MAGQIAKAYVQIIPSAKGISGSISSVLDGESKSAGEGAGLNIAGGIKNIIANSGIAEKITDTFKTAISEGAELEQTLGGIETLFGADAYDIVVENSKKAAKELQISSNEYMQQATSFSASLLQSTGGNAQLSASIADIALRDMSDNANKMGSDIESIQNAYQGFAKQNYTMLDNLKLGYGGTKTEMERLLADAQAMSGVEYNIDNLADVYSAIHVIQESLGLAGVSAFEAETTISGSAAAMSAAFKDLLGNMAIGENIDDELQIWLETSKNYMSNLIPAIKNVLASVVPVFKGKINDMISGIKEKIPVFLEKGKEIIEKIISGIAEKIPDFINIYRELQQNVSEFFVGAMPYYVDKGMKIIASLSEGVIAKIPEFAETAISNVMMWADTIIGLFPSIVETGSAILENLISGILSYVPSLLSVAGTAIDTLLNAVLDLLPAVLDVGVKILSAVINGILNQLPEIVTSALKVVDALLTTIVEKLPAILEKGREILLNIVSGIIEKLPEIVSSASEIIAWLLKTIGEKLPQILEMGFNLVKELAVGLINAIPHLVSKIPEIIEAIKNKFSDTDWLEIGVNIVRGIADGIVNTIGDVLSALSNLASQALDYIKDKFNINSPSKLMENEVGRFIPEGMAVGIEKNAQSVKNAMNSLESSVFDVSVPTGNLNGRQAVYNITYNIQAEIHDNYDVKRLAENLEYERQKNLTAIGLQG